MKHGWKTRIDERRYFEEKLAARKARIAANTPNKKDAYLFSRAMNASMESINGKQWL